MTVEVAEFTVVTGSSSGIGRAIAIELAEQGHNVLIHGNSNRRGAEKTADDIRSLGRETGVLIADISKEEERIQLVDSAFSFGTVKAWVHNAGVDVLTGAAARLSFEEKLDLLWAVDVRGTILLARRVARGMQERTNGSPSAEKYTAGLQAPSHSLPRHSMIFIGWDQSAYGMEGEAGQMFGPIKAAITSYSKSLAQQLAPDIRVNCVAPGWIQTAWGSETDDYWNRRARGSSLMNRWGLPADVAAAVAFLISDEANFVCGQVLEVNGGWNRRFDRS